MASRKPKKSSTADEALDDSVDSKFESLEDDDDDEESTGVKASAAFDSDDDDDSTPVDDHLVDYSVRSREATRAALNAQIEEYLSRGGKINHVDNNVTADPPRKPTSNYGSRPI
ncbi:hypothetical protein [Simiduia aestuariiviva]|uniref:Transcriptional regulator SutA RNAP-binding domain-containing protein n=1 Tax=Simiduia aestuariiviva TaxID=1510459 RepID=A0A839UQ81_9GAMM|nr:hypothetical protein [Simiduia aestuariiviva]MBB3169943.1 hypothetical protein [Simiduia aestuariiviva]